MANQRDQHGRLDPADWEDFRRHGHALLDEVIDYLAGIREQPVWRPIPDGVKAALAQPVPVRGAELAAVWKEFQSCILPYPSGNIHPRFFGWVQGTGTPAGMLAEMLAAAMNANVGGREHAAVYVERQVIDWCRSIFGFPAGSSGVLTTGTSHATILALAIARHRATAGACKQAGNERRFRIYVSHEVHNCLDKAVSLLGLGTQVICRVPVRPDYTMDVAALTSMLERDRLAGIPALCVVATAGTVNTGAVDDLEAIAEVCARHDIWFHVDGAFGALLQLAPARRALVQGIERADSLAFDYHKWAFVPYDVGCLLVRDGTLHLETFATRQPYLKATTQGPASGEPWFCDFGIEQSRGFRALKVWFTLKHFGVDKIGACIEENCRQAARLAETITRHPRLRLLAPCATNIVCYRYERAGIPAAQLDALNGTILAAVQERGFAVPSSTRLGKDKVFAIRVALTNHRTIWADLQALVEQTVALGDELTGSQTLAAA